MLHHPNPSTLLGLLIDKAALAQNRSNSSSHDHISFHREEDWGNRLD